MTIFMATGDPERDQNYEPGEENGYPLQYSCLENSMDRGAWQAIVHGVTKESDMTEHLTYTHIYALSLPNTRHDSTAQTQTQVLPL